MTISTLESEAMAQVAESSHSRAIVERYVTSLYPREGNIILWRTPIHYSLIGLESDPNASQEIDAIFQEFGGLAGVVTKSAAHPGESGLNFVLIFSDNPESLSSDSGLQSLFIGSGRARDYTHTELTTFHASLKNLESGGSMMQYFMSDSDIVFFVAVSHINILKQSSSNLAVRRLLFSAIVHAEGAPPEVVDSILSVGRLTGGLSDFDRALVSHLYSNQSTTKAALLRDFSKGREKGGGQ